MLQYVLRCTYVAVRMGKVIRHAMRRHGGLSHHAAHVVQHIAAGSMLVCIAVPLLLPIERDVIRGADTLAPPVETGKAVAVAEPSSILLLAVGVVVLVLLERRTRRRAKSYPL